MSLDVIKQLKSSSGGETTIEVSGVVGCGEFGANIFYEHNEILLFLAKEEKVDQPNKYRYSQGVLNSSELEGYVRWLSRLVSEVQSEDNNRVIDFLLEEVDSEGGLIEANAARTLKDLRFSTKSLNFSRASLEVIYERIVTSDNPSVLVPLVVVLLDMNIDEVEGALNTICSFPDIYGVRFELDMLGHKAGWGPLQAEIAKYQPIVELLTEQCMNSSSYDKVSFWCNLLMGLPERQRWQTWYRIWVANEASHIVVRRIFYFDSSNDAMVEEYLRLQSIIDDDQRLPKLVAFLMDQIATENSKDSRNAAYSLEEVLNLNESAELTQTQVRELAKALERPDFDVVGVPIFKLLDRFKAPQAEEALFRVLLKVDVNGDYFIGDDIWAGESSDVFPMAGKYDNLVEVMLNLLGTEEDKSKTIYIMSAITSADDFRLLTDLEEIWIKNPFSRRAIESGLRVYQSPERTEFLERMKSGNP